MKLLLVDDEKRVGDGLKRRLRRLRSDWEIRLASSGGEALELMNESPADAVVSDLRMPGMDGGTLLQAIDEKCPSVFRVALTGHADEELILRAARHAHRLIAKPCEAKEIESIVLEGVFLLKHLEDESLTRFISSIGQLPRPTDKLQMALDRVRNPNSSIDDFEKLIQSEPVLAAGILRVANSSFFGGGQVSSVFDAVQALGLSIVQAIVIGELARRAVRIPKSCASTLERVFDGSHEAMEHCLLLHRRHCKSSCDRGDAITACLLQDIGKLIFLSSKPRLYSDLLSECVRTHKNIADLEREKFGCDHAQIGGLLLKLWGIPEKIVGAVTLHHDLEFVSSAPASLASLVFVGGQRSLARSEKPDYFFMFKEDDETIARIAPKYVDEIIQSKE